MKVSTICNLICTKIGGQYYLNIRGEKGQQISLDISQRQAEKVVTELETSMKDYDRDFTCEDTRTNQREKGAVIANIR